MWKPDPRNNWDPEIRLWEDPGSSSNEHTSSRRWVTTYFFGSIMWWTLHNPFAYSRIPRAPTLPVYFTRSCYVTYIRLIQQAIYSLHSDGNTMELLFAKEGSEHVGLCCKVMCRSQRLPCSILSRKQPNSIYLLCPVAMRQGIIYTETWKSDPRWSSICFSHKLPGVLLNKEHLIYYIKIEKNPCSNHKHLIFFAQSTCNDSTKNNLLGIGGDRQTLIWGQH